MAAPTSLGGRLGLPQRRAPKPRGRAELSGGRGACGSRARIPRGPQHRLPGRPTRPAPPLSPQGRWRAGAARRAALVLGPGPQQPSRETTRGGGGPGRRGGGGEGPGLFDAAEGSGYGQSAAIFGPVRRRRRRR